MPKTDGLTGLLNRSTFEAELTKALREARPGQPVGVVTIDLNDFKPINDCLGHKAGDCVLVAVAKHLSSVVGSTGITARLGGDEFAIAVSGAEVSALLDLCKSLSQCIGQGRGAFLLYPFA